MQAIRVHATGGPEQLRYETVPDPQPGPAQVRVRVEAIGVNFTDVYSRTGYYPTAVPYTPGTEAAGTVDLVGPDVTDVHVGDRVAYEGAPGAYAELQVVPVERIVPLPAGVSTRQGAAVMLQGMTAHYLATSTFPLAVGHIALVHAAAGGTGLLLTQIARRRGARVIGTVSTAAKAALARTAGASDVILYTQQDFETESRRLTNGRGVDVVYDSVGATTFDKSLRSLRTRGMMVLFGASSGPVPPIDPQLLNRSGSLFLTRPTIKHYTSDPTEMRGRANDLLSWIVDGTLDVRVDHEFPLREAAAAHMALEGRSTTGKILLIPDLGRG
jgi:NADPH2:quinone reductase